MAAADIVCGGHVIGYVIGHLVQALCLTSEALGRTTKALCLGPMLRMIPYVKM